MESFRSRSLQRTGLPAHAVRRVQTAERSPIPRNPARQGVLERSGPRRVPNERPGKSTIPVPRLGRRAALALCVASLTNGTASAWMSRTIRFLLVCVRPPVCSGSRATPTSRTFASVTGGASRGAPALRLAWKSGTTPPARPHLWARSDKLAAQPVESSHPQTGA